MHRRILHKNVSREQMNVMNKYFTVNLKKKKKLNPSEELYL